MGGDRTDDMGIVGDIRRAGVPDVFAEFVDILLNNLSGSEICTFNEIYNDSFGEIKEFPHYALASANLRRL